MIIEIYGTTYIHHIRLHIKKKSLKMPEAIIIRCKSKKYRQCNVQNNSLIFYLTFNGKKRLRCKLCDKQDDFNIPIVNFAFIYSNILLDSVSELIISINMIFHSLCIFLLPNPDCYYVIHFT